MAISQMNYEMEMMMRQKMAQMDRYYDPRNDQFLSQQIGYAKNPEDTPKAAPKKEEPNPVLLLI